MIHASTQPAGRDLDVLVAEKVMGYRRMLGPGYDYDGPCGRDEILVPPSMSDSEFNSWVWPPRGRIALGYFVSDRYSTDLNAAWKVFKLLGPAWQISQSDWGGWPDDQRWWCWLPKENGGDGTITMAPTAPLAICWAALKARAGS